MAQAITKVIQPVKTEAELAEERLGAVKREAASDADGLIDGLKLLQAMHDRGTLELLVALFERGDKVVKTLVDVLSQPGATNGLRVLITAMDTFSQYDSEAILKYWKGFSAGVNQALETPTEAKPMGIFELLKVLKDPDVSAALHAGLAFLKGVGQVFRQETQTEPSNLE